MPLKGFSDDTVVDKPLTVYKSRAFISGLMTLNKYHHHMQNSYTLT